MFFKRCAYQCLLRNLIPLLMMFGVTACDTSQEDGKLASLHFASEPSYIIIEKSLQLSLVGKDVNGKILTSLPKIDWTSSDADLVTVSSSGLVLANDYRQVTITASYADISAAILLDVVADVAQIEFVSSTLDDSPLDGVYVFDRLGASVEIQVNARDSIGLLLSIPPQYQWESSNESIIQVQDNTVTAVGDGEAFVSVSYGETKEKYNFVVDTSIASLDINPQSKVFTALNQTTTLTLDTTNSFGMVQIGRDDIENLVWASSDGQVALIDEKGLLTSIAEGQVTVSASLGDLSDSIDVFVVNGGVALSGMIRYEDKEYGLNGFSGKQTYKPVRFAQVDLLNSSDAIVDTVSTDAYGQYSFNLTEQNMSIRVVAQTDLGSGIDVGISDINGDLYAVVQSFAWTIPSTQLNIDIPVSSNVAGAFNMLDVFSAASEMVMDQSTIVLTPLNAFWRSGSSNYGTYYCWPGLVGSFCPQGSGIYIVGGSSFSNDTDEFDDDVLLHEFGHYLEGVLSINDSPGGQHYMTDNTLDIRLAWSEGWGDFFHTAVKTWLQANNPGVLSIPVQLGPTYYIDTYGSSAQIALNILNPGTCFGGSDCFVYSTNEISVAKVLLRLNEDYGMQSIFNVIENHLPSLGSAKTSLEPFWDGWITYNTPGSTPDLIALTGIFAERSIYYQEDVYENDNALDAVRKIGVCTGSCTGESHFLYRSDLSPDTDILAFDTLAGKTYIIETYNLKNAADTFVRLLDGNGDPVLNSNMQVIENDDRTDTLCATQATCKNDSLSYASLITFVANTSATYFVQITTSPEVYASSGRYGSYSIKVTEQ